MKRILSLRSVVGLVISAVVGLNSVGWMGIQEAAAMPCVPYEGPSQLVVGTCNSGRCIPTIAPSLNYHCRLSHLTATYGDSEGSPENIQIRVCTGLPEGATCEFVLTVYCCQERFPFLLRSYPDWGSEYE